MKQVQEPLLLMMISTQCLHLLPPDKTEKVDLDMGGGGGGPNLADCLLPSSSLCQVGHRHITSYQLSSNSLRCSVTFMQQPHLGS